MYPTKRGCIAIHGKWSSFARFELLEDLWTQIPSRRDP